MQPSQYINTILVPKDGEIPLDIQKLASQGIFDVVFILVIILIGIQHFEYIVHFAWKQLFYLGINVFLQIVVDSGRDPKVGVIFDPKSLIQAIADLLINYVRTNATKARTKWYCTEILEEAN